MNFMKVKFLKDIKLIMNSEREGTDYIEFFIGDAKKPKNFFTGDLKEPENWNDNSRYLSSSIFGSLFWDSFESLDGNKFDIVGPPTAYKDEELKKILVLLQDNLGALEKINSLEEFIQRITRFDKVLLAELNHDYGEVWKKDWREILDKLIVVNKDLMQIVENCLKDSRVLWVLGV